MAMAVALFGTAGAAAAQETYELKLAGFVSPRHGMSQWLTDWAAGLEEKSGGRLKFEVLHGAQMGPPPKYYDLARNGQADVTWVLHGATPGRFRLTEISNMPFLFCSSEQATRVLNHPKLRQTYLDPEHRGVKVLLQFSSPPGQAFMAKGEIRTVEDFQGKAIRPASRAIGLMISELGGKSVGLPPTSIAESLQKGVIEGAFVDYSGAAYAFQLTPFLESVTELDLYSISFSLVMNPDTYAGLPQDLQEMITDSITGIEGDVGNVWDSMNASGKKVLTDAGVPINELPEAELTKAKAIGNTLTANYVAELDGVGLPGNEVLAMMHELIEQVGPVGPGCQ
ncbi:hypothetical protein RA20_03880 [Leisingera sp. ANG-Vp]|nr:hypothetical protein RA20_03880 [Leisingera sp. ANG-Vp]